MTTANAITNSMGYKLIGGIDIHNLKRNDDGTRIDIWSRSIDGKKERKRLGDFLSENNKYLILARHILETQTIVVIDFVECCSGNGIKEIQTGARKYRMTGGKIYEKQIK